MGGRNSLSGLNKVSVDYRPMVSGNLVLWYNFRIEIRKHMVFAGVAVLLELFVTRTFGEHLAYCSDGHVLQD